MPLGETNGNYKCDNCGRKMPIGTKVWIDLTDEKAYCLDCRAEDGSWRKSNAEIMPTLPIEQPSEPKTVVVRHESSRAEELKKENAALRAEVKRLKEDLKNLRKHAKMLLEISQKQRFRGKKVKSLTLDDELIRIRHGRAGPNNRCD